MLTPCVLLQHHLRKAPGVAVQHRDGTSPPRSNSTATTSALGNGDSSDGCLPPAAALCHRLSGWEKPNKAPRCVHPDPCSPTTREAQTLGHGLQSICRARPSQLWVFPGTAGLPGSEHMPRSQPHWSSLLAMASPRPEAAKQAQAKGREYPRYYKNAT